ncbi:MAG: GNAT family N-acetyltransferase [Armatimonadaceae bacterium]
MTLRDATVDDIPALAALHLAAWKAAYSHILPPEQWESLTIEEFSRRWQTALETSSTENRGNRVIETQSEVAGFVSYGPPKEPLPTAEPPLQTAEIYALYVHPNHWRGGYGRLLLDDALLQLRLTGFQRVLLWTWEQNSRARSFYERLGFTQEGVPILRDRFGAPIPEVCYSRIVGS